jgi:AcrR family transcriptional regulator
MTTDLKPRWERRKDARPQELLNAALDLFVERGFAATRLDDIAKRAGVSKGTLYLYFESKEELFKAVVRESVVPMIGAAEDLVDQSSGSSADLFREVILAWWEAMGKTKLSGIAKLMMAEAGNFPELASFYEEEVISRSDAMFVSLLKRGIARGEFREIRSDLAPRVLFAPMIMLMVNIQPSCICKIDSSLTDDYIALYIDMAIRGLQA